jgi:mRNA interferase MazF
MEYRWSVFIASLDPVIGSEQGKTRPVLVLSQEQMNNVLPVVNVLPLTTRKPGRRVYPNEVLLTPEITGMDREALVLCYQIRTLDKRRLRNKICSITAEEVQRKIIEAVAFQLDIVV